MPEDVVAAGILQLISILAKYGCCPVCQRRIDKHHCIADPPAACQCGDIQKQFLRPLKCEGRHDEVPAASARSENFCLQKSPPLLD